MISPYTTFDYSSVFVLHWDDGSTKVPTDLAGVTLARVKPRSKDKPLQDYTGEELREEIKFAIEEIRDAIGKASLPVTVHYIAPTSSHSEYYGLLQLQLQTQLETGGMSWRFHPCIRMLPQDIYQQLLSVLETATSRDAVLLVPKGLSDPRLRENFEKIIESHKETRIIFLDQQPPEEFLSFEHVSSVGPDNRKVGILAAYALRKRLKSKPSSYWVLGGPGGPSRSKGFMDAMKHFGLENDTKLWPIKDSDRFVNYDEITKFLQQTDSREMIGVFAGNDENAFATVGAAEQLDRENVFVVGCDGSREFRFHMARPESPLVATVYTKLNEQAAEVLRLLQQTNQDDVRLDPELHPYDPDFKIQLQDSSFRSLWNGE